MTADRIPALLEPIQNRLNEVTPGPWFANRYYIGAGEDPSDPDAEIAKASFKPDAQFIAAAPTDQARLLAAVQAVTGIAEIKMNSEHGNPAFVQGWEAAIEEMDARLVAALGGEA